MFPRSLRHPDDRLKSAGQWESLSERLFDELLTARHASEPPAPSELWQVWSKWDDFTPEDGPNNVSKGTVRDWLRAYEASLSPEHSEASPYVRGVASLLLQGTKAEQVPIVVAQDGRTAHVLMLEVTRVENGSGQCWLHPAFEHRSADVNAGSGTFAESMARAWQMARTTDDRPAALDIFWRILTEDRHTLPAMQLDGSSASAAALRAFWHAARGLKIDPDVYVLAEATSPQGLIEPVGHLHQKVDSIKLIHQTLSVYPPHNSGGQRAPS